jgi:hypothetical protein
MGQNIMKIRFRSYANSENNQKEQGNKTSYDRILPQLCFFQLVLPTNSRKQTTKTALQVNGGKNKLYATKSKKCLFARLEFIHLLFKNCSTKIAKPFLSGKVSLLNKLLCLKKICLNSSSVPHIGELSNQYKENYS